jgi:hypothetical protein
MYWQPMVDYNLQQDVYTNHDLLEIWSLPKLSYEILPICIFWPIMWN